MVIEQHFKMPFVQPLHADWLLKAGIRFSLLRLDQIHPEISGNKWFKLKENVYIAKQMGKSTLLTFGGVWSNHLLATAATANVLGMKSIGLVRGLEKDSLLTPTLKHCKSLGMKLEGMSYAAYRQKIDTFFQKKLQEEFTDALIIPEGGNNQEGRKGAGSLALFIPSNTTHVAMAVGTGTTFCGLRNTLDERIKLLGFAPFIKTNEQASAIDRYCSNIHRDCWQLFSDNVWKGFARWDDSLIHFMNTFYESFLVPLDIIYTAKLMYYLERQIKSAAFPKGSHVVAIHSGGLQGNASVQRFLSY